MASLVSVIQFATLFVLVFAVYCVNGLQADELRRYSYEDDSREFDDWIYVKPGTAIPSSRPKPPFRPNYDGSSPIFVGEGQRPTKIPIITGSAPPLTVADPAKPAPIYVPSSETLPPYILDASGETIIFLDGQRPSKIPINTAGSVLRPPPVPIYLSPSGDKLPLYKPSYTLSPSGETLIVVDGQRPSKIPIAIGTAPSPTVGDPSNPLPSSVPIYVFPSTDDLPPYKPSYTGNPAETTIGVDGQAASENLISNGRPQLPPVEDPSKPLPSPVPIYIGSSTDVPSYEPSNTGNPAEPIIGVDGQTASENLISNERPPLPPVEEPSKPLPSSVPIYVFPSIDILPPYEPPYTVGTAETVTAAEGQKPSQNPVTIEPPTVLVVESPTEPLPSPLPINPNPSVCGRKNNCYQWFDDKLQLYQGGYELCDVKDEIRARRYCCIR